MDEMKKRGATPNKSLFRRIAESEFFHMQKRAAEIVGGFLTDYLGEEMNPWQSRENMAAAPSV